MKCVAVGDLFITPDMMKKAFEADAARGYEAEFFYFGLDTRAEMRRVVKTIETGGFESLPLPDGLLEAVADAEMLIVHLCPVTKALVARAPKLRYVLCNRGGHENIDVKALSERNIALLLNPAHNGNAVAEFTIGLMLNETRNIARSAAGTSRGEWREQYPNSSAIREISDMTVGIIGYGTVGRLLYHKLEAFGCRILINTRSEDVAAVNRNIARFVSLDELLRESDIVTLHARLSRKAILLGRREFQLMKPTAYFINTARSYMVDYNDLAAALKAGEIMGAAVDVFDHEPIGADNPLLGLDNCTLTNHRGGDTINAYSDSPLMMLRELDKLTDGDEPRFWFNKGEVRISRD